MYPTCWSRPVVCCTPFVCYTHTRPIPSVSLQDVFRTTILAKIQYCLPAWSGYCSAADRARLDWFLKRCKRRGFCEKELPSVTQIDDADNIFFADILKNNQHVLQTFLPDRTLEQYQLKQRSHNKIIISKTADLNDRDFIVRMLYKDSY